MDITSIQVAVSSLKTASEIARSILEIKAMTEVQGKVIEIQSALLEAQHAAISATASQFELVEKVRALEAQISTLREWKNQEHRYALICPWKGPSQVYALKEEFSNGEAAHFLCTNCFHMSKRVILNPANNAGFVYLHCPSCKASLSTGFRGIGSPKYAEAYVEG